MSARINPVYRAQLDHYRAQFERFAAANSAEPAWLAALRSEAMEGFLSQGFPHTKLEEWRYTNTAPIAKRALELVPSPADFGAAPPPAPVARISELLHSDPDRLQLLLERTPVAKDKSFALLGKAFLDDGVVVEIPRDRSVAEPVHVRFTGTAQSCPSVRHPRVVVTAAPGSRAVVVLEFDTIASAEGALTNAAIDLLVAANASLDVVLVQREAEGTFHVSNTTGRVERDGRLAVHTVTLGGDLVRNDLDVVLADEGASCDLQGLFVGCGSGIVDNHTSVDHAMPHGTSSELYKGILSDESRGVFRGRVIVRPDAQKTDATQSNPNLLLGTRAEIDTKPQLEIYADDVKCAHGATVGQLDPEALFYLQSRGIALAEGRALLTQAFAREITDALPDPSLAARLGEAVGAVLAGVSEKEQP